MIAWLLDLRRRLSHAQVCTTGQYGHIFELGLAVAACALAQLSEMAEGSWQELRKLVVWAQGIFVSLLINHAASSGDGRPVAPRPRVQLPLHDKLAVCSDIFRIFSGPGSPLPARLSGCGVLYSIVIVLLLSSR